MKQKKPLELELTGPVTVLEYKLEQKYPNWTDLWRDLERDLEQQYPNQRDLEVGSPYAAVVFVASYPGALLLRRDAVAGEYVRVFLAVFQRYPDEAIEALKSVREHVLLKEKAEGLGPAKWDPANPFSVSQGLKRLDRSALRLRQDPGRRQTRSHKKEGNHQKMALSLLLSHSWCVKRKVDGKPLEFAARLSDSDYEDSGKRKLRRGVRLVEVSDLRIGEIALWASHEFGVDVSCDQAKEARAEAVRWLEKRRPAELPH